ncbi:MAG: hypothetical protein HKN31_12555, partial [Pricia sp.]|nr:hypothetical protein [Pricia sp.]
YFTKHPTHATSFQNLIFAMANQLRAISEAGHFRKKLPKNDKLIACFEKIGGEITALKSGLDAKDFEEYLIIQNLFEYQDRQLEKLKKITWLLGNPDIAPKDYITKEAARRFVAPQDYDPAILLRNFNFSSNLFKHSLRLALTVMIGYVVGSFLDFQNPYWILLTIIVILRPSYGLTRSRSKQRIIGTLIGGALATGIVFLVHDAYVYGVLGIVSLIIAFSMIQKNYRTAATFITLSVIFIYAIIRPDVQEVIQYRVLDTVVGAALSFMAIWLFWPSWSFQKIESDIEKSIRANKDFLGQIIAYYEQKGKVPIALKVSRKQAFMETSNLSAAFQAMTQEPKSKQNNLDSIYELVVLNHSFLSSLASLSGYIQNHSTTKASTALKTSVNYIDQNLEQVLKSVSTFQTQKLDTVVDNEDNFKKQLISLSEGAQEKLNAGRPLSERDHQEAHLINEQLRWLFSLSQKMLKTMTNRPKTKS